MAIMEDLGAGITDGTAIWRKAFSPSHVATIDEEEPATVVEAVLLHRQPRWCPPNLQGLAQSPKLLGSLLGLWSAAKLQVSIQHIEIELADWNNA